ncbi:sulfatase [Sandaracinus amylolyticus]|uniref:Choline-sulfatase n=1 Tax=Sandaracinus amylolyticus TaxID=927083 RepID=A0A0F6YH18_9BACT|nr:sulfatase [Sandaracinus amylolyticus]AKF05345.1 Choline-sulfatase [Sandaracinus amylolyticus]
MITARIRLVLVAAMLAACGEQVHEPMRALPPPPREATRAENVVWIVVDSLRADTVADPRETPTFARLAERGTVFRARSAATWCMPAVASMLTSLDPDRHHLTDVSATLSPAAWTLPEVLRCEGFETASFISNGLLSDPFGFDQGWDRHVNYVRAGGSVAADRVLDDALAWMALHTTRRFFVHAQLIDPYRAVVELASSVLERGRPPIEAEIATLRARYAEAVRAVDAALARFFEQLDALGLGASTLVVITADHGALLGEGGLLGTGVLLNEEHEELLDVPLLFVGPARPPASDDVVSTRDLAPTVLEALGVAMPERFEGRSFGPRRLRAPEGPELEYVAPSVALTREDCPMVPGYGMPACDELPTAEELRRDVEPLPHAPCLP